MSVMIISSIISIFLLYFGISFIKESLHSYKQFRKGLGFEINFKALGTLALYGRIIKTKPTKSQKYLLFTRAIGDSIIGLIATATGLSILLINIFSLVNK